MNILSARKYLSPRNGQLSLEAAETRRVAYAIKSTASPSIDFDTAAREMAAVLLRSMASPVSNLGSLFQSLNSQPSTLNQLWLVPIPDSKGNTDANTRLASMIARHVQGAQVIKAIARTQPIQSQCTRHKLALGPISPDQHHFVRTRKQLTLRQTYFVDNVTTSGNTMQAARAALGFGAGLVFADAATHRHQGYQHSTINHQLL